MTEMVNQVMTRDNRLWPFIVVSALISYLLSVEQPPTQWDYKHWLQFGSAAAGVIGGIFGNSPLKGAPKIEG